MQKMIQKLTVSLWRLASLCFVSYLKEPTHVMEGHDSIWGSSNFELPKVWTRALLDLDPPEPAPREHHVVWLFLATSQEDLNISRLSQWVELLYYDCTLLLAWNWVLSLCRNFEHNPSVYSSIIGTPIMSSPRLLSGGQLFRTRYRLLLFQLCPCNVIKFFIWNKFFEFQ